MKRTLTVKYSVIALTMILLLSSCGSDKVSSPRGIVLGALDFSDSLPAGVIKPIGCTQLVKTEKTLVAEFSDLPNCPDNNQLMNSSQVRESLSVVIGEAPLFQLLKKEAVVGEGVFTPQAVKGEASEKAGTIESLCNIASHDDIDKTFTKGCTVVTFEEDEARKGHFKEIRLDLKARNQLANEVMTEKETAKVQAESDRNAAIMAMQLAEKAKDKAVADLKIAIDEKNTAEQLLAQTKGERDAAFVARKTAEETQVRLNEEKRELNRQVVNLKLELLTLKTQLKAAVDKHEKLKEIIAGL